MVWSPRGGSQRLPSLCLGGRPDSGLHCDRLSSEKSEGKTQSRAQQAGRGRAGSERGERGGPALSGAPIGSPVSPGPRPLSVQTESAQKVLRKN